MIVKTQGIVLKHIDYKESSIIVNVFTKDFGYQGYVVNSVRSAKPKQGMAYFQPFTVLDMVTYMKPSRDLHRISEFRPLLTWQSEDIIRQSVLLFLAEVTNKLVRNEQTDNSVLFDFIINGLRHLKSSQSSQDFHLYFLLNVAPYIGISVLSGTELFKNMNKIDDQKDVVELIDQLLAGSYDTKIVTSGELRFRVLEVLIGYFQHHVPGFGEVHSLKVLRQIFR